jgi:DNA-binding transcriptional regulator YiaG
MFAGQTQFDYILSGFGVDITPETGQNKPYEVGSQPPHEGRAVKDRIIDGPAIRAIRTEQGISRYQFAKRSGVSVSYLKILEGQPPEGSRQPSDRIAKIIAEALGVTLDDISWPADADRHEDQDAA